MGFESDNQSVERYFLTRLSTDSIFRVSPDVLIEDFADGSLGLRLQDHRLFQFNLSEQRVLALTDGSRSVDQIAAEIAEQFYVGRAQAAADVVSLYGKWLSQGVLCAPEQSEEGKTGMDDQARYLRNPDVALREEDEDGGLLFNPDTNQIKVLNPTGLFIWQQCDGTHGAAEIAQAIRDAFDEVPEDQITQDVDEFIEGMVQSGFLGTVQEQAAGE